MSIALPVRKSYYAPEELSERHREIIRLYMMGVGVQEIAAKMGCGRHHVRYVVNSPLGIMMRKELTERMDESVTDVTAKLAALCPKAVELMDGVLDGEYDTASISLRVRVAESILDRTGFGKVTKTQNQNLNASLSAEDILNLQKAAREEATAAGVLAAQGA